MDLLQTRKAVKALFLIAKKGQEKPSLLPDDDDDYLFLQISTFKILKKQVNPIRLLLPNPLTNDINQLNVFIFSKDPQRQFKDLLLNDRFPYIKKVQGVKKAMKKFNNYESKRLLMNSYDIFLADERIIPLLPKLVGKKFYENKKKLPRAVRLTKVDVKEEIEDALKATYFHLTGGGCLTVKVGLVKEQFGEEKNVDNVIAAFDMILERLGGIANVSSCHLKTRNSVALPILKALPTVLKPVVDPIISDDGSSESEEKE